MMQVWFDAQTPGIKVWFKKLPPIEQQVFEAVLLWVLSKQSQAGSKFIGWF